MDSAQLKKKTDKKGKNAQLWTMHVTLITKRITILFANKLDKVLIQVMLRCRVGLRERKIGNGGSGFWFPPYFHVLNSRRWQKAKQKIALGSGGRGEILRWTLGRCCDGLCVLAVVERLDEKVVSKDQ